MFSTPGASCSSPCSLPNPLCSQPAAGVMEQPPWTLMPLLCCRLPWQMQALGSPGEAARASHSPFCRDSGCWGESLSAQSHAVAPSPQPGAEPAPSSRWQRSLRSLPASGPAARGDTRAVSLSSSWLQRSPASVCSLWELVHQGMVLPRGFQRGSLVFSLPVLCPFSPSPAVTMSRENTWSLHSQCPRAGQGST